MTKEGSNGETTSSTNNIERILNVNGEVPFLESRHIALKKSWSFNYTENEDGELRFETDGIGNELRPTLKAAGMLTRDPRMKERKKVGLKRARKAPQYTKR